MQVLILGYGVSGQATGRLLTRMGIPWIAVDRNGPNFDAPDFPLDHISTIVLSPGIPPTHPIVQRASGIEVIGEIELAMRLVNNQCVGVTGSNGKTTTCSLIAHVLNACGKPARAVGNIGAPLSDYVYHDRPITLNLDSARQSQIEAKRSERESPFPEGNGDEEDRFDEVVASPNSKLLAGRGIGSEEILIIELSSYQLETLYTKKLEVGVILNITPNHLDRYSSMEEYTRAKLRIKECVTGKLWVPRQLAHVSPDIFDVDGICPEEYISIGSQNVFAAEKVCSYFDITHGDFVRALATFKKPAHRVEFVGEKNGRLFYNDSKATSIEAVIYGVGLMNRPCVLLAGGVHKGSSYLPWVDAFKGKVKKIVAYGEAAAVMEAELASFIPFEKRVKFADAVALAIASTSTGDCVLLSPGCSSYDQFENYEHRGDAFKREVM